MARPKSASFTAAPFTLLASSKFSGCSQSSMQQPTEQRAAIIVITPTSVNIKQK